MEIKDIKDSVDQLHKAVGDKLEAATKSINDNVDAKLEAAEESIYAKSSKLVRDEADKIRSEYEAKAATQFAAKQSKSFNQVLADTLTENQDAILKFARKETKSVNIELKAVGDMGMTTNYTGSVFTNDAGSSIVRGLTNRKLHIRDIPELPKGTMNGSAFPYMKENGIGEGNFTAVAENATKPQLDFGLTEASAEAQYIAGWLRTSRKSLADIPGFISYLQGRLLEKLLLAEDDQLINGTGVSPNISGLGTAGNFTAATSLAAVADIEQLILTISQLEEMEREANAILVRPSNAYSLLLNKATGSGEYDLPGIVTVDGTGQLRVLGVPVYRTTAVPSGTFFVGDFRMGAMLLQRENPTIEIFEQDGTNVQKNQVTIRCEERIAFPIFGSTYFVKGTF